MEINCIKDYEAFIERLRKVILDNIVGNYPDTTQDINVTLEQREPFELTLTFKTVSEELEATCDCIDCINYLGLFYHIGLNESGFNSIDAYSLGHQFKCQHSGKLR